MFCFKYQIYYSYKILNIKSFILCFAFIFIMNKSFKLLIFKWIIFLIAHLPEINFFPGYYLFNVLSCKNPNLLRMSYLESYYILTLIIRSFCISGLFTIPISSKCMKYIPFQSLHLCQRLSSCINHRFFQPLFLYTNSESSVLPLWYMFNMKCQLL